MTDRLLVPLVAAFLLLGAGCAVTPTVPPTATTDGTATAAVPSAAASGPTLDLHGRGLTSVPSDVFTRTDLQTLDLSGNKLTGALPAEIRHLTALRTLDASGNAMTGVPAEVGQLRNLVTLDLSDNQLTGLPLELGNLTQLKTFDLRGNPGVSTHDLGLIRADLPNTDILTD